MIVEEKLIILKAHKYGESDLILHALGTRGHRVGLIAKGARKSRKRFPGGLLEPTHVILGTYKVKNTELMNDQLSLLQEATLVKDFPGLRLDYDRLGLALELVKTVDLVAPAGAQDNQGLFNLLGHSLIQCETSDQLAYLRLHFEMKLLYQQGVMPPHQKLQKLAQIKIADHREVCQDFDELQSLQSIVSHHLDHYLGQ